MALDQARRLGRASRYAGPKLDNHRTMHRDGTNLGSDGFVGWTRRQLEKPHVVIAAVVAIGLGVRCAGLDLQSYDHDESVTASLVLQPNLFDTLDVVVRLERSPPLYYVLAWLWSKLFGTGEVGLRSLSVLIGACTIPAAYWTSCQFGLRRRSRYIAIALVALSPYLVWYSQEARSYALLVLFETLALGYFARFRRRPDTRSGLAWAATSVLALCSHYFAIFLVLPQAGLLLRGVRRRKLVLPFAIVAAVSVALSILALAQQGGGRTDNFAHTGLADRAGTSIIDFFAGEDPPFPTGGDRPALVLFSAAAIASVLLAWIWWQAVRSRDATTRSACRDLGLIAVASFGLPLLLALAGIDFFKYHNLIGTTVPLLLFAAAALGQPQAGWMSSALVALVLAYSVAMIGAVQRDHDLQRPDWRGVAKAIGTSPQPRLVFASTVAATPLRYYLRHGREITPSVADECQYVGEVIVVTDRPASTEFDPRRYELVDEKALVEPFTFYRFLPLLPCSRPANFAGFVRDQGSALLLSGGGPAPRR